MYKSQGKLLQSTVSYLFSLLKKFKHQCRFVKWPEIHSFLNVVKLPLTIDNWRLSIHVHQTVKLYDFHFLPNLNVFCFYSHFLDILKCGKSDKVLAPSWYNKTKIFTIGSFQYISQNSFMRSSTVNLIKPNRCMSKTYPSSS